MDTNGARRLNRSSPSCLNRPAQQTDFFHGLLSHLMNYTHDCGHLWNTGECYGSANTNRLFPELGRSSGVNPMKWADVPPVPVLTATYCRPSTA